MIYQWLETFVVSAESLNFRKASEKLMRSQPSVSIHIKSLEEYLNVKLFDRINNRVVLTEAGRSFYPEAIRLIESLQKSVHQMHSYAQGYQSNWTIAISPLMAETILPYVLRKFIGDHPKVEFTIRVEEAEKIETLLDRGEVHLGISPTQSRIRNVKSIQVYEEPVLFVTENDAYDDESGPEIDVKEKLANHYLLTHHHPVYWEKLLVILNQKVKGIRRMKVAQPNIAKRFVQEGLGVSFLPHSIVRRELIEGKLMNPHFDLFELPKVSTFVHVKREGEMEKAFIKEISSYYFG